MMRCVVAAVCFLLVALSPSFAVAEDADDGLAKGETKIGAAFRFDHQYSDNKLTQQDGEDAPDESQSMAIRDAEITFGYGLNADTELSVIFWPTRPGLSEFLLRHNVGILTVSVGQQKVLQNGWDFMGNSVEKRSIGFYSENTVFEEEEPLIHAQLDISGQVLHMQVLNDIGQADGDENWNEKQKPTFILGWTGEYGPIYPMAVLGSYDNNQSLYFDLGIRTELNGVNAHLDYHQNVKHNKGADSAGKTKGFDDISSSITLEVAYTVDQLLTTWFYASQWDVRQSDEDDSSVEREDRDYNAIDVSDPASPWDGNYQFEDNGLTLALGVDLHNLGENWSPYFVVQQISGRFAPEGSPDLAEDRSELMVMLGAYGTLE